jgi:hypothetical protein
MRLLLQSGNMVVATKELKDKTDFERVGGASILIYKGHYYSFSGVQPNSPRGDAVFTECDAPVCLDGFVE